VFFPVSRSIVLGERHCVGFKREKRLKKVSLVLKKEVLLVSRKKFEDSANAKPVETFLGVFGGKKPVETFFCCFGGKRRKIFPPP
jgi:hypothetical protein